MPNLYQLSKKFPVGNTVPIIRAVFKGRYGMHALVMVALVLLTLQRSLAQVASKYDPRELFPALPVLQEGNSFRTGNGEPGTSYWQNRADYTIDASLDDVQHAISGTEVISYTNNSPGNLPYLWLQLDENAFRQHSRGLDVKLFLDSNRNKLNRDFEGGFNIRSVQFVSQAKDSKPVLTKAEYLINDTRMQVRLPQPLSKGRKVALKITYSYAIPRYFYNADFDGNRTDILPTKNGDIYAIAQWYPRLCVFDDVEGWSTLPYLGNGEFYLEYGDFNVSLTLPSAYMVAASGQLLNPAEVFTPLQLARWRLAHNSEHKVFIRTPEEVSSAASRPSKPTCTWKFNIKNSRDFAWTASKAFICDGININLPGGKKALGLSVYPVEANMHNAWERSSEYIKFSIEYFSKKWFAYPYPCAVNVASNVDGMEYPGIVFCSPSDTANDYWAVVNHELGHTWFPMIVGSNERKYAWMDEGFNTFIGDLCSSDFNNGQFRGYSSRERPLLQYFTDSVPPIVTRPDGMYGDMVFHTQYLKTAYLLGLLRTSILGPERFDYAFKKYISDWSYKHPTPHDFFRSINNSAGEDLTWLWKAMFIENYKLDQAVTALNYVNNNPANGAEITVRNLEKAAMPLVIELTMASGKKLRQELPVEIWEFSSEYTFKADTNEPIKTVVLDPDNLFPDVNRENNILRKR